MKLFPNGTLLLALMTMVASLQAARPSVSLEETERRVGARGTDSLAKVVDGKIQIMRGGRIQSSIPLHATGESEQLVWSPTMDRVGFPRYESPTNPNEESRRFFLVFDARGSEVFRKEVGDSPISAVLSRDRETVFLASLEMYANPITIRLERYRGADLEHVKEIVLEVSEQQRKMHLPQFEFQQLPSGDFLVTSQSPPMIARLKPTFEVVWQHLLGNGLLTRVEVSGSEEYVALFSRGGATNSGTVHLLDLTKGLEVFKSSRNRIDVGFCFNKNSELIVYGPEENELSVIDLGSKKLEVKRGDIRIPIGNLRMICIDGEGVMVGGTAVTQEGSYAELVVLDKDFKEVKRDRLEGNFEFERSAEGLLLRKNGRLYRVGEK